MNEQDEIRLPQINREQVLAVGGTILASGVVDLAVHFNPAVILGGIVVTYAVGKLTPEVMAMMMVPGSNPDEIVDALEKIAGPAPAPHPDQRVGSKLKRLMGIKTPEPAQPKDAQDDVPAAQPETQQELNKQRGRPAGSIFPACPIDERLQLGYAAKTQQRFDPPMNMALGRGVLLAGSQGMGKSNIIGLFGQSAGECGMPFLIIDFKGEFYPLCDIVPNGIRAGHESLGAGTFPLTVESAVDLAELIMESPLQVVVDIPSYGGDGDLVALVVAALLHALMDWSAKMRNAGEEPWPCLVIADEAHNFVPQRQNLSGFAMQNPRESFGRLTSAFSRVANAGRSFGFTLILATQRLPNIAKWSIANLQIKVIMGHAEKNDLDACEEETGKMIDREDIKQLPRGAGIVMGLTKEPALVHFDEQRAQHVSNTPNLKRLRERFKNNPGPTELEDYKRSRSQAAFTQSPTQAQNKGVNVQPRERVNEPVEPVNEREYPVNIPAPSSVVVNAFVKVSAEQRETVLKAIIAMQTVGEKLTRTGLRDYLGWDNRQYQEILKPALDEMGLLQKEGK